MRRTITISALAVLLLAAMLTSAAQFEETLLVRPLHDGKVLLHFEFSLSESSPSHRHYTLFPKPLGEILAAYAVESMSLSLTSGRWLTEQWGHIGWTAKDADAPVIRAAPHGAELWAVFDAELSSYDVPSVLSANTTTTPATFDSRWRNLQASLSGLFCASLNQMTSGFSSDPREVFPEQSSRHSAGAFRYATLPRESVCTENLSPFVKMLPCRNRRGLAGLLDPLKLYASTYHSIQVRADVKRGADGQVSGYDLVQSVSVVLDPLLTSNSATWSLSGMLGGPVCSCALSTQAKAIVHYSHAFLTAHSAVEAYQVKSTVDVVPKSFPGVKDRLVTFDLKALAQNSSTQASTSGFCPQGGLDYSVGFPDTPTSRSSLLAPLSSLVPRQPLLVKRYLSASTLTAGVLHVHLINPSAEEREVQLFDALPWFCRVRLSTMAITIVQSQQGGNASHPAALSSSHLLAKRYTPAVHRGSPAQWFLHVLLPASSTISFSLEFEKSLLTANEYPPDVSRGFDVGSAIVRERRHAKGKATTSTKTSTDDSEWILSYTPSLLVLMPFPDFSMPFNVIAFTSTILATFFGSLFNMTYARTEEVLKRRPEYEEKPTMVQKLKALFGKKKQPTSTAPTIQMSAVAAR
jgi:phosphatidylinositol glycan class T